MSFLTLRQSTLCALLISWSLLPCAALAQEFAFERLWPTLPQPWYFDSSDGIAIDSARNVYVSDFSNNRVLKFTADGRLLTQLDFGGISVLPYDLEVDAEDALYVLDFFDGRVIRFSSTGERLLVWDEHEGEGEGLLDSPVGLAVADDGSVFIADRDTGLVSKFTNDGLFLLSFGAGELLTPFDVDMLPDGNVIVSDNEAGRLLVYSAEGQLLRSWSTVAHNVSRPRGIEIIVAEPGGDPTILLAASTYVVRYSLDGDFLGFFGEEGLDDGQFRLPSFVAFDRERGVYVTDSFVNRVQRFTLDGEFLQAWSAASSEPGAFYRPRSIVTTSDGDVLVLDGGNDRIQRFDPDGAFIGEFGMGASTSVSLDAFTIDANDHVYVTDPSAGLVAQFRPNGALVRAWGHRGEGPDDFGYISDIAVNSAGDVYVTDSDKHTVQVYDTRGAFIAQWGPNEATVDVVIPFEGPRAIAVDSSDNVYVADLGGDSDYAIRKFTAEGEFLLDLVPNGSRPGEAILVTGMTIDTNGNIYVTEPFRPRLQVFGPLGELIAHVSAEGTAPGQFNEVYDVALGLDGRVYTVELINNRVQSFVLSDTLPNNKAIIVSSRVSPDSFDNDARLQTAVQASANLAYQALALQGYTKENVFFISDNPNFDLDLNGLPDDVDGEPDTDVLREAIVDWASDADNLILYMIGGAGGNAFLLREFQIDIDLKGFLPVLELLFYSTIDTYLDTLDIPGATMVLIDASDSGRAISRITATPGERRIVISSTGGDEPAYFLSQGALSFSNYFWIQVFNGQNALQAFSTARAAMGTAVNYQSPQLDDDGTGVGNEPTDGAVAEAADFFNLTPQNAVAPQLTGVSPPQIIAPDDVSADFFVENITDDTGLLSRVWGVVTPPTVAPTDDPKGEEEDLTSAVVDLPEFDLAAVGNGRFEGTFDEFNDPGKYLIDFFAQDETLAVSQGKRTSVEKVLVPSNLVISVYNAETNEPIADATVYIPELRVDPYVTGEAGIVVIPNIDGGAIEITVEAESYPSQTQRVSVAGEGIETVAFQMGEVSGAGCFGAGRGHAGGDAAGWLVALVLLPLFLARSRQSPRP